MPKLILQAFLLLLPGLAAQPVLADSSGPATTPSLGAGARQSPEQTAKRLYNDGLEDKERALRYERRAADADSDEDREKYTERAQDKFKEALSKFVAAYQANEESPEILNEMGYALRKTGDFENAIRAYNSALELEPDYAQAIEYRAEALLALGYVDDVKDAYMTLFRLDQGQADLLMRAITAWIDEKSQHEPTAADPAFKEFVSWAEEREQLAEQTQTRSQNASRGW